MKICAFALVCITSLCLSAQHLVPKPTFDAIAGEYSGEVAQEHTRQIIEYHRIQGSPMMAEVAEKVVLPKLKAAGLETRIEQFPSDGKTKYGTFISPMGWEIRSGELWVAGVGGQKDFAPFRICRYADVPMCVSTYSKGGEWSGELVDVGAGTKDSDYQGKDLKGKVALGSGYAANVLRQAVLKHGAVSVVIYPRADDRPDHPDLVRYNGLWVRAEEVEKTSGGFQISRNQYEQLRGLMKSGAVTVRGKIDATLGPGKLTLVHAYIRGTEYPEREVLLTAHLDHPKWSANDNATGSGAMIEAARVLQSLIAAKRLPPPRVTLHFMWVPEFFGTMAWVVNHPEARRCGAAWDDPRDVKGASKGCIIANLNLDMVGEDTVKTNSRFYLTRTPDSVPSFLDGLIGDVLQQTREANLYAPTGTRNYWPTEIIPYTQGSDHDIFLGLGVPSTMLGHDPDWTHHSSEDKLDKTDASEFRRVGVLASAAGWWMASARQQDWAQIAVVGAVVMRGRFENRFIQSAIQRGQKQFYLTGDSNRQVIGALKAPDPKADYPALVDWVHQPARRDGLRRLIPLPFYDTEFEDLSGEDKKWWEEQTARFSDDSEGLATKPTLDLVMFEAVNFMNGQRTTNEIADLLAAEFLIDIDQPWVERLVGILERQKLVTK
jgi:aminopeptidase YwaD